MIGRAKELCQMYAKRITSTSFGSLFLFSGFGLSPVFKCLHFSLETDFLLIDWTFFYKYFFLCFCCCIVRLGNRHICYLYMYQNSALQEQVNDGIWTIYFLSVFFLFCNKNNYVFGGIQLKSSVCKQFNNEGNKHFRKRKKAHTP